MVVGTNHLLCLIYIYIVYHMLAIKEEIRGNEIENSHHLENSGHITVMWSEHLQAYESIHDKNVLTVLLLLKPDSGQHFIVRVVFLFFLHDVTLTGPFFD